MTISQIEISEPKYTADNLTMLTFHSSHLNARQDVNVYYQPTSQNNLPIVILLHGVYGSNWVWMNLGGVHQVYDKLRQQGLNEFILVMPSDGGLWQGSAYLPLQEHGNYEQWIMDDVLTAVQTHIPAASSQSNIYITGLSMGGYGALRLGAKFASRFAGISAHSSVTNLTDLQTFIDNPIADYQCALPDEDNILYWSKQNLATLPPIRFDCGKDDALFASNNTLSQQFDELGVLHSYQVFDGGHQWQYWHEHVAKSLLFFDAIEQQ